MALKGDERRLIAEANLHLPGRQIDPQQVQRDIWRLGRWERERLERNGAGDPAAPSPPPARHDDPIVSGPPWPASIPSTTPARSSRAPPAPARAPS